MPLNIDMDQVNRIKALVTDAGELIDKVESLAKQFCHKHGIPEYDIQLRYVVTGIKSVVQEKLIEAYGVGVK